MTLALPLHGVRVIEFDGIGPAPVAGRILSGMGAEVTLVARPTAIGITQQLTQAAKNPIEAGKHRVVMDLKNSAKDRQLALELIASADVLLEGLRPGAMERLGFGPADCATRNPRLVYARMTGWGQKGPLAQAAGHDLNYLALSGLLSLGARAGHAPIVPPTVVGDAAGALGMAFGIVCGLFEARQSGQGRVVDCAIVDVAAMLGTLAQWLNAVGQVGAGKPSPFHDSPFYDCFECADGRFVTVGALEPQFYALMLDKLGLGDVDPSAQYDTAQWPSLKARVAEIFRQRSRDEWCAILEGTDVCFAPVLDLAEAPKHPHNLARGNFAEASGGVVLGQVAPRFAPLAAD